MTRLGTATKLRLQLTPSLARTREFSKSRVQLNRLASAVQPRPPRAARRPRSASRSRPQIEYPAGAENSFGLMGSPDRRRKGVRPGGVPAGAPPKVRPARRSMRISFFARLDPHAYPASLRVLAYVMQHFLNDPVEGALHLGGDSSIEAGREQHLNLRSEGVRRASASIAGVIPSWSRGDGRRWPPVHPSARGRPARLPPSAPPGHRSRVVEETLAGLQPVADRDQFLAYPS